MDTASFQPGDLFDAGRPAPVLSAHPPAPGQVLVWDPASHRRQRVCAFIEQTGGQPRALDDLAELAVVVEPRRSGLAVVAVGSKLSAGSPNLDLVRSLKSRGWRVLAYEDHATRWAVGTKCLPLLAGAVELLDSAEEAFARKFRQRIEDELRSLAGQQLEEQSTRSTMERLGVVGESPAMVAVFRSVIRFSVLSDLPVLITGETGTGKELVARAIHRLDLKRAQHPFVALNCGAVSPTLAESELFGHRRGAFTGAERERAGLIRSAAGGVVFLDEIGELERALQTKLLRVLQESSVLGVGEERETPVNVRFVAATNRDLEQMVADRNFRSDLFHRLRVLVIHIPPLRERAADQPLLVRHFVEKHRGLRASGPPQVSEDFVEAFCRLELPGNARQLENLVRQALVNRRHADELGLADLPVEVLRRLTEQNDLPPVSPSGEFSEHGHLRNASSTGMNELVKQILDRQGWNLPGAVRECERQMCEAAMQRTHGNQTHAARLLGITVRSVYNKMRKHHLAAG